MRLQSLPCPGPGLVRPAQEVGELHRRVSVQGDEEHVRAVVEDRLGAVAVVVVEIEDGDPSGTAIQQMLGGDGRVVEEAVAAVEVRCGVVARRAAQGEGGAFPPIGDEPCGRERGLRAGVDGTPGSGRDRRRGVEAVPAEEPVDPFEAASGPCAGRARPKAGRRRCAPSPSSVPRRWPGRRRRPAHARARSGRGPDPRAARWGRARPRRTRSRIMSARRGCSKQGRSWPSVSSALPSCSACSSA